MATLADAFVRLRADTGRIKRDVKQDGAESGKVFGGSFRTAAVSIIATIGVGAAAKKAFDFLKSSTGAASDLNETVSKSSAVWGANAAAMQAWSKNAARSLGLSQQAALENAASFGNFFKQLGVAPKASQQMSRGILQLSADLASFNNISGGSAEVSDMFTAALRGEYDPIQRVLPAINAAAVQTEALRQTHKKSAKDLTNAEKATALYTLAVKGAGPAVGDFAKTSGGAANQQRIMNAEIEDAKAKLGQGLLPIQAAFFKLVRTVGVPALGNLGKGVRAMGAAFKEGDVTSDGFVGVMERIGVAARIAFDFFKTAVLPRLRDFAGYVRREVVPRVAELGRNIGMILVPTLINFGKFLRDYVLPALRELGEFIIEKAVPAISAFIGWLADHKDVILAFAIAIAIPLVSAFVAWAVAAGSAAVATIAAAAPVILMTAVVAGLVYGIIQLVKHWDVVSHAIVTAAKFVWNWFKANWPLLLGIITGPFGLAVVLIIKHWDSIKKGLKDAWDWIWKHIVVPIRDHFTKTIPNAFRAGVAAAVSWWDGLRQKLATPINFVINTILNKGIIDSINWVAKHVGVKARIPHVPGINVPLTGTSPAHRDVSSGNVRGDGPGIGGKGDGFGDLLKVFTSPAKWLANRVGLGGISSRFGNNPFAQVLAGAGSKVKDFAVEKIKDLLGFFDFGGGSGTGGLAAGISAVLATLRSTFGAVGVISGFRPGARTLSGNVSYHSMGRAIDIAPVLQWAQFLNAVWGTRLRELITPWNNLNILNGRPHRYTGAVWNQHNFAGGNAHIHAALDDGGLRWLRPGLNVIPNGTGRLEPIAGPRAMAGMGGYTINVYAAPLAHPADIGKEVVQAIQAFERNNGKRWRT